jgi:hypothetical protein
LPLISKTELAYWYCHYWAWSVLIERIHNLTIMIMNLHNIKIEVSIPLIITIVFSAIIMSQISLQENGLMNKLIIWISDMSNISDIVTVSGISLSSSQKEFLYNFRNQYSKITVHAVHLPIIIITSPMIYYRTAITKSQHFERA